MFKSDDKPKQLNNVETVIGPSVKVEGDFIGNGDVVVEGAVIGNLKTKGYLKIGSEAKIQADVEAQNAYIAGEVVGNVTIAEHLDLTATGKISGDIITKSLTIDKGAYLNGKVSMNETGSRGNAKAGKETDK